MQPNVASGAAPPSRFYVVRSAQLSNNISAQIENGKLRITIEYANGSTDFLIDPGVHAKLQAFIKKNHWPKEE